ncbi:MAG: CoA ester lyase [Sphingomonadales bacterium]|nr:CoA ester lyase [Sphingomonadales bacterium]
MNPSDFLPPRSALYLPASNARAIEKARGLAEDLVILDLEDAVKPEDKDAARKAAFEAVSAGFPGKLTAIRINGSEMPWHDEDVAAVSASASDLFVVPKVEDANAAAAIAARVGKPLLAMIETPLGVLRAPEIGAANGVVGLIAGTNDLANTLHLPDAGNRDGMSLSLQLIVLAARASGIWALDGVFNDLADPDALAAQCAHGRSLGFDGKTLIHPNQIDIANRSFSPSASEIEDARALIAAASGGAERFRDRMIETMHVEMAERLLVRAGAL